MRIISNFVDYYDAVQRHGQDRSLVYVRKERPVQDDKTWPLREYPLGELGWGWSSSTKLYLSVLAVGFAGEVFPLIRATIDSCTDHRRKLCYSLEDLDAFVEANYREDAVASYRRPLKKSFRSGLSELWPREHSREVVGRRWAELEAKRHAYAEEFVKARSPCFVAFHGFGWDVEHRYRLDRNGSKHVIVWDACLREYEFYRVRDPNAAFQAVEQWLSNQANPNRPIPHVSDEDLAAAKGFDEWSFRKPPSGKRRKR